MKKIFLILLLLGYIVGVGQKTPYYQIGEKFNKIDTGSGERVFEESMIFSSGGAFEFFKKYDDNHVILRYIKDDMTPIDSFWYGHAMGTVRGYYYPPKLEYGDFVFMTTVQWNKIYISGITKLNSKITEHNRELIRLRKKGVSDSITKNNLLKLIHNK